jgi:hypothetical protein
VGPFKFFTGRNYVMAKRIGGGRSTGGKITVEEKPGNGPRPKGLKAKPKPPPKPTYHKGRK